jgi:hypothetical protein
VSEDFDRMVAQEIDKLRARVSKLEMGSDSMTVAELDAWERFALATDKPQRYTQGEILAFIKAARDGL